MNERPRAIEHDAMSDRPHVIDGDAMRQRPHAVEDDTMSAPPHVLEIDSIVLQAAPRTRPERLATRIEAEVSRVLGHSNVPARTLAQRAPSVAAVIARTIVHAIGTGIRGA